MVARLFLSVTLALLLPLSLVPAGCTSNPRPRPPRPPARPSTRPVEWPTTFPTTRAASRPSFQVSEMRIESLEPRTWFYVRETVLFQTLHPTIDKAMADLSAAAAEGRVRFDGPPVLRYLGLTPDLRKPFVVEVGFPVAPETNAFGRFKVRRDAEPFRCAAVTFAGSPALIDKAYDKLIPAMEARRLVSTEEAREVYLRWQGLDAPDNEVLVAIGIR
jgi:hypothetical protein